jgi:hypothetical protein
MNKSIQSSSNSSYFAVVSPCSTCNNQRSEPDMILGLPACPRREAQAFQSQLQIAGLSSAQVDPLVLTGNENNPTAAPNALVNPVYSDTLNTVLVWIATIPDNPARYDDNGNVVNPMLLDPSFDSNYISCRKYPVTTSDTEAAYRTKGAWSEGDQLKVTEVGTQQTFIGDNGPTPVLLGGFAEKVNFSYSAPRTPLDRDYSVAGT